MITFSQIYRDNISTLKNYTSSPELDARVIIAHILKNDFSYLNTHPETTVNSSQKKRINDLVEKRKNGEPIAYLTGHKEFYGLDFKVDKNVLIPRPESEFLVKQGLEFIKPKVSQVHQEINILDMGTGSGCLIISLVNSLYKLYELDRLSTISFYAVDISKKALRIAKKNAKRLISNKPMRQSNNIIKFYRSDLFSNTKLPKKFDLIIANLPYVPKDRSKNKEVRIKIKNNITINQYGNGLSYEPTNAIFAEDNGTAIVKIFLEQVKDRLNSNGLILLELDPRNILAIKKFTENLFPQANIKIEKDLAGFKRYLIFIF